MKKIGIMSMQRVVNYGSYLQAYGLSKTIQSLGYSTEFVDYKFEKSIIDTDKKQKKLISKIISNRNIICFIKKKIILKKFDMKINQSLKILGIEKNQNFSRNFDTLVIGSDEVFNCLQPYPVGYSRNLFGKDFEDKNVISYAASFGFTTLEKLKKFNIDNEIKEMLLKFGAISVRDQNSFNIVNNLLGVKPTINFDPVLITNFTEEIINNPINPKYSNYIIVYAYTGRLKKEEEKYIIDFAKKYNKKIISLGFYQKIANYNLTPNPFEVLNYIKNADYVITDTFHGTIFSAKMNTKFCTIIRDSNKNKLEYLLKKLNLNNRQANTINDIGKLYNQDICFDETNKIIKEEEQKSIRYLKENL